MVRESHVPVLLVRPEKMGGEEVGKERRERLNGRCGKPDDERSGDEELRHDHGGGRIRELEPAERAASRDEQPEHEADHHRRHPHPRVHEGEKERSPAETPACERQPGRTPDDERKRGRGDGDKERAGGDREKLGIAAQEQPEGFTDSLCEVTHPRPG